MLILKNMERLAKLALLTATLIWGSSFIIMKDALDDIGTFFLLTFRFAGATLILGIIFIRKLKNINGYIVRGGFMMGSTLILAYIVQTFGLAETTPGKNAFLTAGYCIMVPFFYWAMGGKRPDRFNITAAVMAIVGIGLVALDGDLTMGRGDFLTVCCGVFYALNIIESAKYTQKGDVILLTIMQFFWAAVISGICFLIFEPLNSVGAIPTSTWLRLGYLCAFATAAALGCQTFGLKYVQPAAGSLILSLESVFGVLFSVLFGAEVLSLRIATGFVVIFIAIVISETKLSFLKKEA